jgi:hypothetical protein
MNGTRPHLLPIDLTTTSSIAPSPPISRSMSGIDRPTMSVSIMETETVITNWQQAFKTYRIPQTRAIEKQIRSSAAQNKDKLRTLVG